jgi:hypothetical protein
MANARKTRQWKQPHAEFEIALDDALQALLRPQDVEPGDTWHFYLDGAVLRITRTKATEEAPPEGS